jgi:hypothetical protein
MIRPTTVPAPMSPDCTSRPKLRAAPTPVIGRARRRLARSDRPHLPAARRTIRLLSLCPLSTCLGGFCTDAPHHLTIGPATSLPARSSRHATPGRLPQLAARHSGITNGFHQPGCPHRRQERSGAGQGQAAGPNPGRAGRTAAGRKDLLEEIGAGRETWARYFACTQPNAAGDRRTWALRVACPRPAGGGVVLPGPTGALGDAHGAAAAGSPAPTPAPEHCGTTMRCVGSRHSRVELTV